MFGKRANIPNAINQSITGRETNQMYKQIRYI